MFISILGTWDSVSELLIVGDVRLTSFWTGILEPLPLVGDIRYFPAIKRGNWTSPTNRVFFIFYGKIIHKRRIFECRILQCFVFRRETNLT